MSPQTVLVFTYGAAAVVVALYIWFVVWRIRVDRRKKAADTDTATKMSAAIARAAQLAGEQPRPAPVEEPRPAPMAPAQPTSHVVAPMPTPVVTSTPSDKTVASLVSGIALPHDLVPLGEVADRPGVGDRVAFWTNTAPAEAVGPAFSGELLRLGYAITPLDQHTLAAQRGDDQLIIVIHADGPAATIDGKRAFTSVPERSTVIEVWIPA